MRPIFNRSEDAMNAEAKTENVFEGGKNTDGRQGDAETKPSRFRPLS